MYHYTYKLTADKLYYIGVRSSVCEPNDDKEYWSSSKLVEYMIGQGIKFHKEILTTHETRFHAEQQEQRWFNELNSIADFNCINLSSHANPYTPMLATDKMLHFKTMFSELNPTYCKDPNNLLTAQDLVFKVAEYHYSLHDVWFFVNHPEHLKHYYPSTGTQTYWPGRPDHLMSTKKGIEKKYSTDMSSLNGTAQEQIYELIHNHYVAGQRIHVLEIIEQQMTKLKDCDWRDLATEIMPLLSKDNKFIVNRILNQRKKLIKVNMPCLW